MEQGAGYDGLKFYIRIAGIIADLSMNNIRLARALAEK